MNKNKIIGATASVVNFARYAENSRTLRQEALRFQTTHEDNPYSNYLLKYGRRPEPDQAANFGRLMGLRLKASDGSMQPIISNEQKEAKIKARKIVRENELADAELSRACDAIAFLAENNLDPQILMGRLSPLEEQRVDMEIDKAIKWLNRFADERRRHGQNRIVKAKE